MQYTRHQAWSILLRLFHWCFALSFVTLVITGLYIHFPWTNTMLEGSSTFPVATMRYIHFIAGFVFTGALLARVYLLLFGNRQERFWDFLPITPRNIKNLLATLKYYLYMGNTAEHRLGHNALGGMVYFITFIVAALQIISGFYMLYPESTFWQVWGLKLLGTQQQARFLHYLFTWYFLIFVATHLYIVIWNDVSSKEGMISSIFNGTKYMPKKS
ncbi:MAG TPA: Ni/Fe-hydrogenase, b-type cytochrome subunit [Desulfobulbus sp.]|nr:Ni/Fe-hydrogenase, b-type cytochrome subunit [Desulfobulbus sp.]